MNRRLASVVFGATVLACALVACQPNISDVTPPADAGPGGGIGGTGGDGGTQGGADAGGLGCAPCIDATDCANGACIQVEGDDVCAPRCSTDADCAADFRCLVAFALDGTQGKVCIPTSGSCSAPIDAGAGGDPDGGGGTKDGGTTDSGVPTSDGGMCGALVEPSVSSCCHSCTPGTGNCQANGCYGGWWCDTSNASACACKPPPSSCQGGGQDGGSTQTDGGTAPPPTGTVGADGGTVSRLFFAVVGDTRPANVNDTASYPTAVINQIYSDLEAMNPKPQFVVTTGDYMFASPSGTAGDTQLQLYTSAMSAFTGGPVFAALGNHECTGATASNCATTTTNNNFNSFVARMLTPLGKTKPYYSVHFQDPGNTWSAKLVLVACNAWDATQKAWLTSELSSPSTFTIVARHEPLGVAAPCTTEADALITANPYNLMLVGHTHTFSYSTSKKQVIVGNGGAPISSSTPFGYATVEQLPSGGFKVTQYDASSAMPLNSFVLP